MSTDHNRDNPEHVSRREAMRRGALGAAGMIAAGGLSSRVFAAEAKKTPAQIAAQQKAARDAAAKAKAKNPFHRIINLVSLKGEIAAAQSQHKNQIDLN